MASTGCIRIDDEASERVVLHAACAVTLDDMERAIAERASDRGSV
jgi:hypothetical protein